MRSERNVDNDELLGHDPEGRTNQDLLTIMVQDSAADAVAMAVPTKLPALPTYLQESLASGAPASAYNLMFANIGIVQASD